MAHAGRPGVVVGVVPSTVAAMRERGASTIHAWVGPRVCGGCYEVPASMRDEVAAMAPAAYACTTWGTPSVDIGAAVISQLERAGCTVHDVAVCTRESADLYSHRRDGASAGRFGGIVVRRDTAMSSAIAATRSRTVSTTVRGRISAAADGVRSRPGDVTLVVVTKTWPVADLEILLDLGVARPR